MLNHVQLNGYHFSQALSHNKRKNHEIIIFLTKITKIIGYCHFYSKTFGTEMPKMFSKSHKQEIRSKKFAGKSDKFLKYFGNSIKKNSIKMSLILSLNSNSKLNSFCEFKKTQTQIQTQFSLSFLIKFNF